VALEETGAALTPGIGYGEYGEGYFRIAVSVDKGKTVTALPRMHAAMGKVDFSKQK
jgi:LL-diaminopimelate aminotransferase